MTLSAAGTPAWLAEEVVFLCEPSHHLFAPAAVAVVETHQSWVFLTERHAYKLKKAGPEEPALTEREAQCRREIELNRRLTDNVYLGALPLTREPRGLAMDGPGTRVDWLVWMRRLPEARMLDRMIARGKVDTRALRDCVRLLASFYAARPPAPVTAEERRAALVERVAENEAVLVDPSLGLRAGALDALCEGQRDYIARHARALDRRVHEGRVVDGHGDLRPEHVCLEARPQVIDCLDFSAALRTVDAVEELGFLALECERLGAPELGAVILDTYRNASGDRPPAHLVHFYQGLHATVRAKLAAWHRASPGSAGAEHWAARARDYIALAERHLESALGAALRA